MYLKICLKFVVSCLKYLVVNYFIYLCTQDPVKISQAKGILEWEDLRVLLCSMAYSYHTYFCSFQPPTDRYLSVILCCILPTIHTSP